MGSLGLWVAAPGEGGVTLSSYGLAVAACCCHDGGVFYDYHARLLRARKVKREIRNCYIVRLV